MRSYIVTLHRPGFGFKQYIKECSGTFMGTTACDDATVYPDETITEKAIDRIHKYMEKLPRKVRYSLGLVAV